MRKLMIAPSVGCCDLFHVEEQVKLINEKSDYLHMDIKDGVYVPSYGIGPDYLDYLNKHVENLKPMDAHLMVKHPQQYLETFAKAGAAYITPHTDCIEGDAFVTIHKMITFYQTAQAIYRRLELDELADNLNPKIDAARAGMNAAAQGAATT